MKIRNEQIQAFADERQQSFEVRAFDYLRQHHRSNELIREDAQLRLFIENGVRQAHTHRITKEIDTIRFLEVLLVIGTDFEARAEYQWASEFLALALPSEERLDRIIEFIRFQPGAVKTK